MGESGTTGRDAIAPEDFGDRAASTWLQALAPYGIFTTDAALNIRSWNQWLANHSGLASEQVVGRPLFEVFPEIVSRRFGERYQRALAGEISVLSTALHKYLLALPSTVEGGGLAHMLQTARIAPLPGVGGTITIIEDVTQREAQAALVHRQQQIEGLLSGALAALLESGDPLKELADIHVRLTPILHLDALLVHVRSATGYRLATAAGVPPKARETLERLDDAPVPAGGKAGADRPEFHAALRGLGLRGHHSYVLATNGGDFGQVTFASYQWDELPAPDQQVLARVARYVAIALDRIRREQDIVEASRAKDDFLAALSHELRTPLSPVLLVASESAQNPDYPAEVREAFQMIEKNVLLEARLIDDLLDLTRIERGKIALERSAIDLHAVVHDALVTLRADILDKRLAVTDRLGTGACTVLGDAARLQQVFWNVLKNSIKFTAAGGSIVLTSRSEPEKGMLVVEISDSGIGMEPHEIGRVFGAFRQGDHAQPGSMHRFGGLGLGLAISRKIVELHRGRITASSEGRGQGATFTVVLPLLPGAVPAVAAPAPSAPAAADPALAARILLVEDHEPTRAALARLLRLRGYAVTAAGTAASARRTAAEESFDLVISDIGLPEGDGYELMSHLAGAHGLRGIALSGYGMEADVERSRDAGFVTHLTKPVSLVMLERALNAALAGRRASNPVGSRDGD